jgi:uncharacterized protein YndB with AHSA1/START domain
MNEYKNFITVQTVIEANIDTVWEKWVTPADIIKWNNASEDWHTTKAENDIKDGGKFLFRMEAKDGSMGFDFEGIYNFVKPYELIEYSIADGRKVNITFVSAGDKSKVIETFETENVHPIEMQRAGWQSILDNFKKYVESGKSSSKNR